VVGVPAYKGVQETAEHSSESSPDFHLMANGLQSLAPSR
jgi:hypothetical protein